MKKWLRTALLIFLAAMVLNGIAVKSGTLLMKSVSTVVREVAGAALSAITLGKDVLSEALPGKDESQGAPSGPERKSSLVPPSAKRGAPAPKRDPKPKVDQELRNRLDALAERLNDFEEKADRRNGMVAQSLEQIYQNLTRLRESVQRLADNDQSESKVERQLHTMEWKLNRLEDSITKITQAQRQEDERVVYLSPTVVALSRLMPCSASRAAFPWPSHPGTICYR